MPLTLRGAQLRSVISGRCIRLRRPAEGVCAGLEPGALLWIREPFRLKSKFDGLSPTAAMKFDARPYFAASLDDQDVERNALGKERPARTLLRAWHRHHVRIAAIERQRLQDITDAEIHAEGLRHRETFARAWDAAATGFAQVDRVWANNPEVLVLTFARIPAPLDQETTRA